MDQKVMRNKFKKELTKFIDPIEISDEFWEHLKQHSQAYQFYEEAKELEDETTQKVYIFLVFTETRETCNEMIGILRECGQEEAANKLQKYNTSPKFMPFSDDIKIAVRPAFDLKEGNTKQFSMVKKPRGMALIINIVKDLLENESLRFENVFKQLLFDVKLLYDLTENQLKEELEKLRKSDKLSEFDALIVMIVGHGVNEKIKTIDNIYINISEIVGYFSEDNCIGLIRKPKLFFFNVCREKPDEECAEEAHLPIGWINNNKYTTISYSCAEGHKSWFDFGISCFGQALSHCIAQYACDKPFQSIMSLTCQRTQESLLNLLLKICPQYHENASHQPNRVLCDFCQKISEVSPEFRSFNMTRELYFNPHLFK